ncbi:uncharacterized protein K02A2.6-like [Topomyia yanbarensis]|uniref:uncharacterized protein K02A2.6-like n=1 Tax=Topomyia yanbarensis TaxID=2498891 RepID=UPI00273B12EE|nr:uncharacterized protein K02A2.6-like [Topomyia yanbarensis]
MDEILADCDGTYWYFDDVIIDGNNIEEHDNRVEKVLSRLKERGVELKWEKCRLRVAELEFLGHRISEIEIRPSESKVAAFMSFREPQNEAEPSFPSEKTMRISHRGGQRMCTVVKNQQNILFVLSSWTHFLPSNFRRTELK